ncbi:MAG: TetR/AcrR family transcriptional regulator [Candidatus Abyssobacteria bacterium SURF_5]|uniref:TetR/AcrR family transcriptional regulator n=1 Tax=Abyssobacteria bacterium (strain SURF_5) TaxID=2093360 RepID=A0A3A4PAC8_ABYX5|nr:MAG: TetR/AcrR family transcriptional regulator [Candidatus Abyssubacteria bacterium SURF_5]
MASEKLKTEIRREQIAEAALGVIAMHGIKGLNVARIARRIGLVPSALYRHFRGKDEVLDAVLAMIEQRLLENVDVARREQPSAPERLQLLLRLHIKFIRENQGVLRVIFSEDLFGGKPARKARVYGMIRRYLHKIEEIVREGQAQNVFRSELNPETVSIMFLGLIQPAAILWNMSDGEFDVTRHSEKAWNIFSEMIVRTGR